MNFFKRKQTTDEEQDKEVILPLSDLNESTAQTLKRVSHTQPKIQEICKCGYGYCPRCHGPIDTIQ